MTATGYLPNYVKYSLSFIGRSGEGLSLPLSCLSSVLYLKLLMGHLRGAIDYLKRSSIAL